ncbi:MAG: hypothetical protein RLP45_13030 [Haliea sp.]
MPQSTGFAFHFIPGKSSLRQRLALLAAGLAAVLLLTLSLPVQIAHGQVPCCLDDSEIDEQIEEDIEEDVAEEVEGRVDQAVGETIEDSIEESIQDTIDESVEATVEESVADTVEESVEESVADTVEESVEESVADTVEESVEESVADTVEESVEESVADTVEESVEFTVVDAIEERLEAEIDSVVDELESQLEIDEARINTRQWLVMAEPEVFDELAVKGYLFDRVTDLPGMGLVLAEVEAPSSFEIYDVREGVIDVVGRGRAEVDLNHVYTAGAPVRHSVEGSTPRSVLRFPSDTDDMPLRLGMIDSLVDTAHPALSGGNIHSEAFAGDGATLPSAHGTAIASIFVGQDQSYLGLAPKAELYAAAVFE